MFETAIYKIEEDTNNLYIKRDDLIPFSFGGNKARKAFNFFGEIDSGDYDCVVTYGSSSSNHCRVVSNLAASRKMPCYIISPEEASQTTPNSKMMNLFKAEVEVVPVDLVHETIEKKLKLLHEQGKKPYFIAGGGHGNLGTQAYVDCYNEIRKYEKDNHIFFDYIFHASGTGTTQAGLICGQILHDDIRKIIGISIARKNPRGRQIIIDSINDYFSENNINIDEKRINNATVFLDDYTESGYGRANDTVLSVVREMMTNHGIPMDVTYTAKAYAGMKDYIRREKIEQRNILFIHTGGTPLFFDSIDEISRSI